MYSTNPQMTYSIIQNFDEFELLYLLELLICAPLLERQLLVTAYQFAC